MHQDVLATHIEECLQRQQEQQQQQHHPRQVTDAPPGPDQTAVGTHDAADAAAPTATQTTSRSDKPNAFSVLTQNASDLYETHIFFLGLLDGHWHAAMWLQGSRAAPVLPAAAWTAEVKVTLPNVNVCAEPLFPDAAADEQPESGKRGPPASKRQVTLKLVTNVTPRAAKGGGSTPLTTAGAMLVAAEDAASARGDQPERMYKGPVALLKSALQKCVRRSKAVEAARLAHALLHLAPADALRRIPVICLEDALLHPRLPAVVWLLCAQPRGYSLTADHRALVLELASSTAACALRDPLPGESLASELVAGASPAFMPQRAQRLDLKAADALCGCPESSLLVKCLLLRASYGGMRGDVSMLHSYAALWLRRFASCPEGGGGGGGKREASAAELRPGLSEPCSALAPCAAAGTEGGLSRGSSPAVRDAGDEAGCSGGAADGVEAQAAADRSGGCAGRGAGDNVASGWLSFLRECHAEAPLRLGSLLQRRDIPLAAVDHHVSNLVTVLMKNDSLMDAVLALVDAGGEFHRADPVVVFRTLIWRSRAGQTNKQPLRPVGAHIALAADQAFMACKDANQPRQPPGLPPVVVPGLDEAFWSTFSSTADNYARSIVNRAFEP